MVVFQVEGWRYNVVSVRQRLLYAGFYVHILGSYGQQELQP